MARLQVARTAYRDGIIQIAQSRFGAASGLSYADSSRSIKSAKIKPRPTDNPTRLTLVLLSRWFEWRNVSVANC